MYQSSIWVQSIAKPIRLPEPEHWGFKKTDNSTLVFDWGTQLDIVSAKNGTLSETVVAERTVRPMEGMDVT